MDAMRLKEILDAVRIQPDLRPELDDDGHVVRTFCNIGLDRILGLYGAPRMVNKLNGEPLCANDMVAYMRGSNRWEKVDGGAAVARASQGVLVVAAQAAEGHGHVVAVYPAPAQHSGSWGKDVPMLNNIGRPFKDGSVNMVAKASLCFRTEPEYFSTAIRIQEGA